jgi:predicted phosphodiesterase
MKTNQSVKSIYLVFSIIFISMLLSSCGGINIHSEKVMGKPSKEIWFKEYQYHPDSVVSLVKKSGKDFKILLLADIQIDKWHCKGRKKAFKLMDKLVDSVQPDFIVTLGDNTQGYLSDLTAKKLSKHIAEYNIPWTVVLGNHDSEGRRGRPWFGNQYENAENSLFKYGPSNIHGVGNHTIYLEDENGDLIYSFIMMDSNTYREYETGGGYDFIHRDQMEWYKWQVKGVSEAQYGVYDPEQNKVMPSMCIFHIPLPEFDTAFLDVKNGIIDSSEAVGEKNEAVASAKVNSGFFDVLKEMKSTTHVFCGHDHVNNYSVNYQGIQLSYGLKSAPTSYFDKKMQGGTLVTIKADDQNKEKSTAEVETEYIYITK